MPGNDDLGSMSAWWVLSALGLAPVIPGTDVLLLNAPLFKNANVHLPGGDLQISRSGQGGWVQSLRFDGSARSQAWLHFSQLAGGGTLHYTLGQSPGQWGTHPADAPPSFPVDKPQP